MDRDDNLLGKDPRKILAENLIRLKEARYKEVYASQAKAGKAAGHTQSTIDRLEAGETNTGICTVGNIAAAFGLSAWQLLVPDFNPQDPPILALTPAEKRLIRAMRGEEE